METSFVLIVLLLAALATGGLMVNWIGLGRAMLRTPFLLMLNSTNIRITLSISTCRSWLSVLWQEG
ncbi:hypothetical protein HDF09_004030 [Edaphobacter lichenicola]|uniref:Uncharacterized protein n=1 Tax=Tunturiibacter empetritectus TaxID=3069691 RepID=A0A7W8ILH3_9BACT|nr:hypothetical protein [Edaphobacter lichenicola]